MANSAVTLSYQPLPRKRTVSVRRHRFAIFAIWPLMIALVPIVGFCFGATSTKEPTPQNFMVIYGSLFSPFNFMIALVVAFFYRREWIGLSMSIVAGLIALANALLVVFVLRNGFPC